MCRAIGTEEDLILGPAESRFVLGALPAIEKPLWSISIVVESSSSLQK